MPKLDELQEQDRQEDLANYYYVYNEEYNALLMTDERTAAALLEIEHDTTGVDAAARLRLRSLQANVLARMHKLDEKMLAFHANALSIKPPTSAQISKVKNLSAQVAQLQVASDTVSGVVGLLTQMAKITSTIHSA
jgi:hypothetical protein